MSDLVGNLKDRFSRVAAQILEIFQEKTNCFNIYMRNSDQRACALLLF